ncbi:probable serine/threonine-protein kinase PBL16 [Triticum aestivum]|uniref:probable serine/threonine-protein kinase PBL16 n=1 Tax=Triticum aestivum TaxID=4565 RepID=UPI001D033F88|nr:probable serine/threonine-protein kinase PBL16 [Triticum aestivum]
MAARAAWLSALVDRGGGGGAEAPGFITYPVPFWSTVTASVDVVFLLAGSVVTWDPESFLSWVRPCTCHVANVKDSGLECPVMGTFGYVDPEYCLRGRVKPASDVYSLGVLMLEVLTGKRAFLQGGLKIKEDLACFASPIIEAGNIMELLDKRPVPEPTPLQLQALKRVAQIARCCVKWVGRARPAISDIVANLEMVQKLICRDEPCLVDESVVWPFLEKVDESPHAKGVPSAGYQPNLVHQKLIELCSH